jgi:hypothetical protein
MKIITSYLNHLPDWQRKKTWQADKTLLNPLIESCKSNGINLVILNNCFESDDIFINVKPNQNILPNMARWLLIYDYLQENKPESFFCVDSTDVELVNVPKLEKGYIYSGDEWNMKVRNNWMRTFEAPNVLVDDYNEIINKNLNKTLLNCGVVGGYYSDVMPFIYDLSNLHLNFSMNIGCNDMAMYNYLMYKKYINKTKHGFPVCSKFKEFEKTTLAWFRHK